MTKVYLENKEDGHNKFYEMWAGAYHNEVTDKDDSAFVGMRFGRIGTEGTTNLQEFIGDNCRGDALRFLDKKLKEKLNKGYTLIKHEGLQVARSQEQQPLQMTYH